MVGCHGPFFGFSEGERVGVEAADGRGEFPEGTGDLGCQALGFCVRGPFLRNDSDVITAVEEDPGCNEAGDTTADDENVRGGWGWRDLGCGVEREVLAYYKAVVKLGMHDRWPKSDKIWYVAMYEN